VSGTLYVIGKVNAASYGWAIRQSNQSLLFSRSINGSTFLDASVTNCLEVGKPVLFTASFSTTGGATLSVDAFAAGTEATTTATNASTAVFSIGASGTPGNYLPGKIHYAAYYDNYVVSQAEHDAMYNDWKSDGILPLNISSTAAKTKLIVECEVKAQFASATDNGAQYRSFLAIGGQYGTSSTTRNNFYLQATANASSYAVLHTDDSATDRYIYSAVRTDHDKWTRHKWVVNTADLANSTYHINGVAQTGFTQMTGTASFGLRDTLIRIGQSPSGGTSILGNMEIRNVKLGAE